MIQRYEKPLGPEIKHDDGSDVLNWLREFALAVREENYQNGRKLFAPEVVGFGTSAAQAMGLEQLEQEQWKKVWGFTRNFHFEMEEIHFDLSGELAWVAAPFCSQGRSDSAGWFDRRGRATYILSRRGGKWVCVHSHHSLNPLSPDVKRP
jgi:ketosteroid isomerase-like protein